MSTNFVSFQVCQNLVSLQARLSQDLVFVVSSVVCRVVELVSGHRRPSLFRQRYTVGVFAGTHQCATESRVTLWQSDNPCCVLVGGVPCDCVRGHVPRSCATDNTYIFDLDLGVQVGSVKQPTKRNSVGSGHSSSDFCL